MHEGWCVVPPWRRPWALSISACTMPRIGNSYLCLYSIKVLPSLDLSGIFIFVFISQFFFLCFLLNIFMAYLPFILMLSPSSPVPLKLPLQVSVPLWRIFLLFTVFQQQVLDINTYVRHVPFRTTGFTFLYFSLIMLSKGESFFAYIPHPNTMPKWVYFSCNFLFILWGSDLCLIQNVHILSWACISFLKHIFNT